MTFEITSAQLQARTLNFIQNEEPELHKSTTKTTAQGEQPASIMTNPAEFVKNSGALVTTTTAAAMQPVKLAEPYTTGGIVRQELEKIVVSLDNSPDKANYVMSGAMHALLASEVATQLMPQPATLKSSEAGNAGRNEATGSVKVSGSTAVRHSAPVENGTDLTPASGNGDNQTAEQTPRFINVLGDPRIMRAFDQMLKTTLQQSISSSESSAKFGIISASLAEKVGNKIVAASRETLNGAITGGVVGLTMQGGATVSTARALNKSSKSITHDLGKANAIKKDKFISENGLGQNRQNMMAQGNTPSHAVDSKLSEQHGLMNSQIAAAEMKYQQVELGTQRTRNISDWVNAASRSTDNTVQSIFGVNAALENKQAEKARNEQQITSEIVNSYHHKSDKDEDKMDILRQAFKAILESDKDAFSYVTGKL